MSSPNINITDVLKKNTIQKVPRLGHLFFYNEGDIISAQELKQVEEKVGNLIGKEDKYSMFLQNKCRHPFYDIYACFQPFNEATKAVYPFLKKLQETVKKGEAILNLWDRTGWMTNLLAGLFPENLIITTWEGNKDVLGYRGYHYWMKNNPNIQVVFCDLNKPLPFQSNSIAFSVGLDVLHRFDRSHLLDELIRIVKEEGAILFPHVHLSNAEPKDYFERGGTLLHGTDYTAAFNQISTSSNLEGYVFSEPELFTANDVLLSKTIRIESNPTSTDYNALIALLPKSWKNDTLSAFTLNDIKNIGACRILVNLLIDIDLHHQTAHVNHQHLNGKVGELLNRHPIYLNYINQLENYTLTTTSVKIIYLAKQGYTINEIVDQLKIAEAIIIEEVKRLQEKGLIAVLPISEDGIRLQYFLMSQSFLHPKKHQTLASLWKNSVKNNADKIAIHAIEDQSEFTFRDCADIVENIQNSLLTNGLKKGDCILISCKINAEAILLSWACFEMGIILVPISIKHNAGKVNQIMEDVQAKICFFDEASYTSFQVNKEQIDIVVFDGSTEVEDVPSFSDWLEEANDDSLKNISTIDAKDVAVIIYTSGSTGLPKAVQLTQGNLFRSGQIIANHFNWNPTDVFFTYGGLETMSGFRNATIAPLVNGTSIAIPGVDAMSNLFALIDAIQESQSTIFSCNPALLGQLVKHETIVTSKLQHIKTLMCTGNVLSEKLREQVQNKFNQSVLNYYGATETSGICIAQKAEDTTYADGNIGSAIDCIAQIVDNNNNIVPIGEKGELRIYSTNLMKGYLHTPTLTEETIQNGWYYTKDIGSYTKEGTIVLHGRTREIIKTPNEDIIYIKEIQEIVTQLDFIEDALITSFIQNESEKIAIFIVVKPHHSKTEQELNNEIRAYIKHTMGAYALPGKIIIVDKLPYNENGKLNNELIHAAI